MDFSRKIVSRENFCLIIFLDYYKKYFFSFKDNCKIIY